MSSRKYFFYESLYENTGIYVPMFVFLNAKRPSFSMLIMEYTISYYNFENKVIHIKNKYKLYI